MAGLPGTGLGGVFYVLLVPWMLLTELLRLVRGQPLRRERWIAIGVQSVVAGVILGVLWVEALLVGLLPRLHGLGSVNQITFSSGAVSMAFAYLPILVLAVIFTSLRLAVWLVPNSNAAPVGLSAGSSE